ncbi:MAG: hypothetical protein ACI4IL_07385 [Eubacterium sp.]
MLKRNRIISVIVAVAMAIGLVSSALFIIENSEHNCLGEDCQVCAQINLNLKLFDNQTPKPENALLTISFVWIVVLTLGCIKDNIKADTLISLKIKLSN